MIHTVGSRLDVGSLEELRNTSNPKTSTTLQAISGGASNDLLDQEKSVQLFKQFPSPG